MQILFRNILKHSYYQQFIRASYSSHKQINSSLSKYTPIYSFPYIKVIAFVNRLKLYQTGLTLVSIPSSIIASYFELLGSEAVASVFVVGLTCCVTLYGIGQLCNKFIGFIYVNEDSKHIKVAYVDFWGRRKDVEIPVKEIVPFSEMPSSVTDKIYRKLLVYSTKDSFKLNMNSSTILDKNKFDQIFVYHFR